MLRGDCESIGRVPFFFNDRARKAGRRRDRVNADAMRRTNAPGPCRPLSFSAGDLPAADAPVGDGPMIRPAPRSDSCLLQLAGAPGPPHRSPSNTIQIGTYIVNRIIYLTFNFPTFLIIQSEERR